MSSILIILSIIFTYVVCIISEKPNIIFVLTDDQDTVIGGETPMAKTKNLIGNAGITFWNMFVTSPLCCPSRSSILTGRYVHNHGALNNSISGNCSSPAWQKNSEPNSFATELQKLGYETFFAGKYLNQYGFAETGGPEHIPPGWDDWYGLIGNSRYYNYSVSNNGKKEDHSDNYTLDYFTDRIGDRAMKYIEGRSVLRPKPFFMMLATPACHAPFTPAPQYVHSFPNVTAPRGGSFNVYGKDKHWLMRQVLHPMNKAELTYIDDTFVNRWRTLLTVDDIVENLVKALEKKKLLDNTYIIFSSDNGFHLGQFSLPNDKRQMYEFDIRVPLMVRGPGIPTNITKHEPVLNIDLGPTFIELAGGEVPTQMDGMSFKGLLGNQSRAGTWRVDFGVEHSGEWTETTECPQWNHQQVSECFPACVCEDAYNNTYACVRELSSKENLVYCVFSDSENFVELYDLNADPHQLKNLAKSADPALRQRLNQRLTDLVVCSGPSCRAPPKHGYQQK